MPFDPVVATRRLSSRIGTSGAPTSTMAKASCTRGATNTPRLTNTLIEAEFAPAASFVPYTNPMISILAQ